MQTTIQYIEKELADLYPKSEVQGFIHIIFEYVCGFDYTALLLHKNEKLDVAHHKQIVEIVSRLTQFEPIQYILGETEFFGLKLKVKPGVLIPRPETEELVHWITTITWPPNPVIFDIGTGSGCIALALKKNLRQAQVSAVDFSEIALQTARENAALNKLDVKFFLFNILQWSKTNWPLFDGVVSNPPYVRELEKKYMHANVLNYEPETALFVPDNDPLIFYRQIGLFARKYLKPEGKLFFEINESMGEETIGFLKHIGFKNIEMRKDINGKYRMIKADN